MDEPRAQPAASAQELTQRQREILTLLRAGKVNKEIARELGIGLGTVKQHVVAIFKRLHVNNRAMAAARREATIDGDLAEAVSAGPGGDGILERRPCVVLSLALPEHADKDLVKRLHASLAAQAFEFQAVFLARQGHSADIIFGIHQVHEYDLLRALQTAYAAFIELMQADAACAAQLRGGLTAGLVVASMRRFGGWSGEAIASSAITTARELADQAQTGQMVIDQSAQDLMLAFGIGEQRSGAGALPFDDLDALFWSGDRIAYPLVGRRDELAAWKAALARLACGQGGLIYLEGETGMGKSRLCHELALEYAGAGGTPAFHRGQPFGTGHSLRDVIKGDVRSAAQMVELLGAGATAPRLTIIDDLHLLAPEDQTQICVAAAQAAQRGCLTLLSGRNVAGPLEGAETIRLRRLPMDETATLVREVLTSRGMKVKADKLQSVVSEASGVPLFAVELARHRGSGLLAMPLLIVVCARLDGLQLDHRLLAAVSKADLAPPAELVAHMMQTSVEAIAPALARAVAAGVLGRDADGRYAFTHPVIRLVIEFLRME
ncbi:MAG: LuxR C-terminal-related transcriptional regulator [Pseudomonadota bacterium]